MPHPSTPSPTLPRRKHAALHARWGLLLVTGPLWACHEGISGPGLELVITRQPTVAVVGEPLAPSLEVLLKDYSGRAMEGDVTVAIDPNPCGWLLDGTTTVHAVAGRAVFEDLKVEHVASGYYRLVVQSGGAKAFTVPFDVRELALPDQPLVLENTLCAKPNPQKDAESLEYVPGDDVFWLADDNLPSIFEVERATGRYLSQIPADRFVEAFPEAGQCDDGDGDSSTSCSFVDELEHIAYDVDDGFLYVLNTVNNPQVTPQRDHPALFRLLHGACSGCWSFESWRALPEESRYEGMVVIDGALHVAIGARVYGYDFEANRLLATDAAGDSLPPTYVAETKIERLHYDGAYLWAILGTSLLRKIDLETQADLATYDLSSFDIVPAKGVEVVGDRIYVLNGASPNPIYVFRVEDELE